MTVPKEQKILWIEIQRTTLRKDSAFYPPWPQPLASPREREMAKPHGRVWGMWAELKRVAGVPRHHQMQCRAWWQAYPGPWGCDGLRSFLFPVSFVVCLVTQMCATLCNPLDCSPPGSSVHGIFQARILEWVAISSSRGSSQPSDQT